MELKGLEKRKHNILFHTHTVSGIVISFALFICFFAGAFALFRDELYRWENPTARYESPSAVDLDRGMQLMEDAYPDMIRGDRMNMVLPSEHNPELKVYAFVMNPDSTQERASGLINTQTYEFTKFDERPTHMADTLYELHYFRQIPGIGRYLSGLVALFFLFATFSGLLIHWRDMFRKFWALRTTGGWKQLWKDAHTTLAFIGLPFQVVYGVTGALLGLSILLLAPSVLVLFNGDDSEVRGILDPFFSVKTNIESPPTDDVYGLNNLYADTKANHPTYITPFIRLKNYGLEDGAASFGLIEPTSLGANGSIIYGLTDGRVIHHDDPQRKGYNTTYDTLLKLHYATFGGVWLKWVYFFLTLLTCFMIIAGVLLWDAARDNKKYTPKQRRFHHHVTKIYLAICLGLIPATALIFLANSVVPFEMTSRVGLVDTIFFLGWLVLIVLGIFQVSYRRITRIYLLITAVLALLIPIANGIMTGDWLWSSLTSDLLCVGVVDLLWLLTGVVCLLVWRRMRG